MAEATFKFDKNGLTIIFGWVWLIIFVIVIGILIFFFVHRRKKTLPNLKLTQITTDLGFGTATFEVDYSLRQTAYSIYIELTTRKIAMEYEEDKDVIVEVYDSWYKAFGIIRDYLRTANVESLDEKFVIDIKKILNDGLRLHLTNWQAKFRLWYKNALADNNNANLTPQEIQKKYEFYHDLVNDLVKTNKLLIQLSIGLHDIVFGNKGEK